MTYEQIADECKLNNRQREMFLKYMNIRWKNTEQMNCKSGYAFEWAMRFKNGTAYDVSDSEGQAILDRLEY